MHIQPSSLRALLHIRRVLRHGHHARRSKLRRSRNRLSIVALALLAIVPLAGVSLGASLMEKHKAAEQLEEALHAAGHAPNTGGLFVQKERAEEQVEAARVALEDAEQHKAQARRKYVEAQEEIETLKQEYGIDATNTGAVLARVRQEREKLMSFAQYMRNRSFLLAAGGPDFGLTLAKNLLHTSLGDITDMSMRNRAMERASFRVFAVSLRAMHLGQEVGMLQQEYDKQLDAYQEAWDHYREALGEVRSAEDRIAEVQRITNEVQAQITGLQRELARIDARLIAKLERELIEKGLISAQPGERSDGRIRSNQTFRWPVVGKISAGFYNAAYKTFFGVAHKGIDIVVPQGSRVSVAADGVVYLARDGGRTGYSYVLVGHRDGYATLYGHLSSINVSSGQEIAAGHVVGYSGGTPGTYGAGPMTTGAHLHFEVIKGGSHIDPQTILP